MSNFDHLVHFSCRHAQLSCSSWSATDYAL